MGGVPMGGVTDAVKSDKRSHHNSLERKRRDHIKDSFNLLRESLPTLMNDKVCILLLCATHIQASRTQILSKAAEYIVTMRKKNQAYMVSLPMCDAT